MKLLFLDIENTLIDNLNDCNFLHNNCKKISKLIKDIEPRGLNFFTWGWKEKKEIDINIVNNMLIKLGINPMHIGRACFVLTKATSVNAAIKKGWLKQEDYDRAIQPGMMKEFGLSKVSCFVEMVLDTVNDEFLRNANATIKNPIEFWLIDDLIEAKEEEKYFNGLVKIVLLNPKDLK